MTSPVTSTDYETMSTRELLVRYELAILQISKPINRRLLSHWTTAKEKLEQSRTQYKCLRSELFRRMSGVPAKPGRYKSELVKACGLQDTETEVFRTILCPREDLAPDWLVNQCMIVDEILYLVVAVLFVEPTVRLKQNEPISLQLRKIRPIRKTQKVWGFTS